MANTLEKTVDPLSRTTTEAVTTIKSGRKVVWGQVRRKMRLTYQTYRLPDEPKSPADPHVGGADRTIHISPSHNSHLTGILQTKSSPKTPSQEKLQETSPVKIVHNSLELIFNKLIYLIWINNIFLPIFKAILYHPVQHTVGKRFIFFYCGEDAEYQTDEDRHEPESVTVREQAGQLGPYTEKW